MTKKDKKEFQVIIGQTFDRKMPQFEKQMRQVFNEGIEQLILPHFERIYKRLDNHDKRFDSHDKRFNEINDTLQDHTQRLGQIERKLDAEIDWRDEANKKISKVENQLELIKK